MPRLPINRILPLILALGRNKSPRSRGRLRIWPLALFAGFAAYYYFSNKEVVPVTGRSQVVAISPEQMLPLALSSYQKVLSQSELVTGGQDLKLVQEIAARIIKVVDRPDLDWEVNLIKSEQANAFALPGGKIAVYTGLLPIAENAAGLATVISHEVAHIIARHGAERMTHQKLVQYGTLAVGLSVGEMDIDTQRLVLGALGLGSQYGYILPFSREHESEADYIGLMYLAKACFDPEEAPRLWQRMGRKSKHPPELLSTHPAPSTRTEKLTQYLPQARQIYHSHCG